MKKIVGLTFISGASGAIVTVVFTPLLIEICGVRGYGVIALWQLLLGLILLCDLGFGNTATKFIAEINNNKKRDELWNGFVTFEKIFLLITCLVGVVFYLVIDELASHLVKAGDNYEYKILFYLMGVSILTQLYTSLYANILSGFMAFNISNVFQLGVIICRFAGGYLGAYLWGGVLGFFIIQACTSPIIVIVYRILCLKKIGEGDYKWLRFNKNLINAKYKYSIVIFITGLLGLLIANMDRYLITAFESIDTLGVYSIATTASSLLVLMAAAFYKIYFPKMVDYKSRNLISDLTECYKQGTKFIATVIIGMGVVAITFAKPLFEVWIGNPSEELILIFRLQITGLILSGVMWLTAALQQAVGMAKLHAILMAVSVLIGLIATYYFVSRFGIYGYTATGISHGLIEISLGLLLLDGKKFHIIAKNWYIENILINVIISISICFILYQIYDFNQNKIIGLMLAILSWCIYIIISMRKYIYKIVRDEK